MPQGSDSPLRLDAAEPTGLRSQRSRSARAAAAAHERLEGFFELSLDLFCIVSRDGLCERVNRAFARLVDFEGRECLSRRMLDFVHPADRQIAESLLERLVAGEPAACFECRLLCEGSRDCWISWHCVASPDGERFYCVGRHHPDCTLLEQQLQHSRDEIRRQERVRTAEAAASDHVFRSVCEERNRAEGLLRVKDRALDSALSGVAIADLEGRLTYVNPAWLRIWGYEDRQQVLGKPATEFWQNAEDAAEVVRLLRAEGGWFGEIVAAHCDGGVRHLQVSASLVTDVTGQPAAMMGSFVDVTERVQARQVLRESEEKLRAISDSALDAVIMMDQEGRVVHWNPAAQRMFGYRAEEIEGRDAHEALVPAHHREQARAGLRQFSQTGQGPAVGRVLELSALHKDGSEFPVEMAVSSVEVQGGWWATAIIRDISERKQAERKFQEREVQLLAAQRIQRHLLPERPPVIPGLDIAGATYPAQFAAGDLYDYLQMPGDRLGLVVSDVSGHGFAPALLVAATQTLLKKLAEARNDAGEILTEANAFLAARIEDDRFVTVFLGSLDLTTRTLTYASAGHPTGYVLGRDGEMKTGMESTWLPLGVLAESTIPAAEPVALAEGDTIVLLTDGVLEARSPELEPFGSLRALEVVRTNLDRTAREIIDRLHRDVCRFTASDTLQDDVTAMIVRIGPR